MKHLYLPVLINYLLTQSLTSKVGVVFLRLVIDHEIVEATFKQGGQSTGELYSDLSLTYANHFIHNYDNTNLYELLYLLHLYYLYLFSLQTVTDGNGSTFS